MTTLQLAATERDDSVVDVARVIVLIQGSITLLSVLEVLVLGLATGTMAVLGPTLLLTGLGAVLAFAASAGLARRSGWARRMTIVAEVLVLITGYVDLGLAVGLARAPLDLVPLLTRVVAPIVVIVLLRRPVARAAFRRAAAERGHL